MTSARWQSPIPFSTSPASLRTASSPACACIPKRVRRCCCSAARSALWCSMCACTTMRSSCPSEHGNGEESLHAGEPCGEVLRALVPVHGLDVVVPVRVGGEMLFVVVFARIISIVQTEHCDACRFIERERVRGRGRSRSLGKPAVGAVDVRAECLCRSSGIDSERRRRGRLERKHPCGKDYGPLRFDVHRFSSMLICRKLQCSGE